MVCSLLNKAEAKKEVHDKGTSTSRNRRSHPYLIKIINTKVLISIRFFVGMPKVLSNTFDKIKRHVEKHVLL